MKENIEDKLRKEIIKNFIQDELPDDFTDKTMKKIMAENPYQQQTKAYNQKTFIPAFITIFAVIVLAIIFIPESAVYTNQNYYLFSDFLKHFKISFPDFTNIFSQLITGSVIFKVLPFSVILLLMVDMLISKKYQ